jgi:hypothetical protein
MGWRKKYKAKDKSVTDHPGTMPHHSWQKNSKSADLHQRPKHTTDKLRRRSALAGLESRIGLVDDIDPALAADQLVVAMALHQALERIAYFHETPVKGQRTDPARD